MIQVEHLTRSYGPLKAVDDVSFAIGDGEVVGLLGHNGAGKTTIMKMMTGFLEPTSGAIKVDQLEMAADRRAIQAMIGYLPENCPVYPEMTVAGYLEYIASLHGISAGQMGPMLVDVLERTSLMDKAGHLIGALSRGYRQRVGVAQAILHRPKIVILDEPTNGLDPTQIQHMRGLIRELAKESYTAAQQAVIRDTRKAYYQILLAKKLVEANRQGLEVIQGNYKNVQAQYRVGAAAEYDLLRAEVQLANTEPLVISAENGYQLAVNALKNLLAIPLDQPLVIEGDLIYEELPEEVAQQAEAQALATNPAIKQLSLQERMLDRNISIEKAGNFPTLYAMGSYLWQSQDNTFKFGNYNWANTINAGVSLSYPLFDGFRTRNRVQQAKVDRNKVRFTRLKMEEGLRVQIQAGSLRMAEARKRMSGQEKNIEQAQKAVRIAQTRFQSGVGTQLELLDAQVAMTRSQTNYAQALYDYLVSKTEWEFATGTSR
mgnify:CR=1 FL=1